MSEDMKTSAEIILGGKTIAIQKLKAGEFYKAQKVIADILRGITKKGDPKNLQNQDGKESQDLSLILEAFDNFPTHIVKFISICAKMEEKTILDDSYPEEIGTAFGVCLDLNNVMENLKNSVAPMEKLGAKGTQETKADSQS